jgi:hypothetical protein
LVAVIFDIRSLQKLVGKFGFIGSVGVCYPYTINSNDSHPNWMIGGIIRYLRA